MNFLKKNKKLLGKIKWFFLLSRFFVSHKEFQRFLSTYQVAESTLDELITRIRRLLKLNPTWAFGHFYYSLLSFRKFQFTKQLVNRGAIRLSIQALSTLNSPVFLLSLTNIFYDFLAQDYDKVRKELEELRGAKEIPKSLKYLVLELLGSTLLITESKESALLILEEIPEKSRTAEVSSMISLIKAS